MDFSRKLGRHVERFKQSAQDAAGDGPDYECRSCGAGFVTEYEECPDCGAEAVEPADGDDSGNGASSDGDDSGNGASSDGGDATE